MGSLFSAKPSSKAIQILENTEIVAINSTELFKLYYIFSEVERLLRKIFVAAYDDTVNRIEGIKFHSAVKRYDAPIDKAFSF